VEVAVPYSLVFVFLPEGRGRVTFKIRGYLRVS